MHQPRKTDRQQISYINSFERAITAVVHIPLENQSLLFKEWITITVDETEWLNYIDAYFESCKTTDEEWEDDDNTCSDSNNAANN